MAFLFFTAVVFLASVNAIPLLEPNEEWNQFLEKYNPQYKDSEEYAYRKQIFQENLKNIQQHNIEYNSGLHTYRKGINQFADRTIDEKKHKNWGFQPFDPSDIIPDNNVTYSDSNVIPESIDWRTLGAVTTVKNQGNCASCWVFAEIGVLEGQYFLRTNKSVSFSEQQHIDCSEASHGCDAGDVFTTYLDFVLMRGIATDETYPFSGKKEKCKFNEKMAIAKVTDLTLHQSLLNQEEHLKQLIALQGPAAVSIEVTKDFQEYDGGVFYDDSCSRNPDDLNHAVLLVGYGSENGNDYWIVKNSWGQNWGEGGYIKMSRNRENNCQIASVAAYVGIHVIPRD